jgi:hypothetical protein
MIAFTSTEITTISTLALLAKPNKLSKESNQALIEEAFMNNPTNQKSPQPRKIHELIGQVLSKDLKKVYNQKSPHHGSTFYRLNVALENSPLDKIYVFPDTVETEQI